MTLTDVTHVDWDRGVLVCPDDAVADVEAALGAAWRDAPPLDDDDVAHLLLSSAGAVAEDIRLDRSTIDPCARATDLADRTFGITASLEVAPASSGRGWTIRVG
ncbi:hypothetical protein [Cellulomonas fimi]|uniref:Uncharacterized protein n=1 Tax=Cellulomonas fimi TaxID=1708 RepID=A0A7Y0LXG6_CELFI|nr:hypothetical protein [Cellulomonas fimi]NMR20036.1 hypothetical protein [Cellulomonas fimi]